MTTQQKIEAPPTGLALLRAPFPEHQISKLPKETRAQIDARKTDKSLMVWKCEVCKGAHHKNAVHLDYVGHAALTDRLLDADPAYACEPMAYGEDGLPCFDRNGGLWVRLTVCGVTRMGYGDADGKTGGNAVKEAIGDAMRNAAMRFGAALDLWHKGDLHVDEANNENDDGNAAAQAAPVGAPARTKLEGPYNSKTALKTAVHEADRNIRGCGDLGELEGYLAGDEFIALKKQLNRDAPEYLFGGGDLPDEFEPLKPLVDRIRHDFQQLETANQMAEYART